MFSFLDVFSDGLIGLSYSIYIGVANFYHYLTESLIKSGGSSLFDNKIVINGINVVYSIIAIFMLFRIVISLLSYLINPDQAKDKTVGGGKLLTRIIIVILLIMLTMPISSDKNGLLFRSIRDLQSAMLGSETDPGLIENLFSRIKEGLYSEDGNITEQEKISSETDSFKYNFIDKVNATDKTEKSESKNTINCYYTALGSAYEKNTKDSNKLAVQTIVYVAFNKGDPNVENEGETNRIIEAGSGVSNAGEGNTTWKLSTYKRTIKFYSDQKYDYETETGIMNANNCSHDSFKDNIEIDKKGIEQLEQGKCPNTITNVSCWSESEEDNPKTWYCWYCNHYGKNEDSVITQTSNGNTKEAGNLYLGYQADDPDNDFIKNDVYVKYWGEGLIDYASNAKEGGLYPWGTSGTIKSSLALADWTRIEKTNSNVSESSGLCDNLNPTTQEYRECMASSPRKNKTTNSDAATVFAGTLYLAFVTPLDKDQKLSDIDPNFTSQLVLKSETALNSLKSNHGKKIDVSSFLAIIFGIAAIIFIFVLGIDVIVRNCKLILLEIMSPIAILAYLNPKDKTLSQWSTQFVATFADLFLKLISIQCIGLFVDLLVFDNMGLGVVFIILGVLTFAKIVPDFISKIFGIKAASGTLKDSFKMLKAASFAAAGGAIALGRSSAGIFETFRSTKGQSGLNRTASVFQSLGTVASSTLRGIGGGTKGNLTTGWQYASNVTAKRRALYESGVGAAAAMGVGLAMGMYNPNHKDEQIEKTYDDILSKRKTLDSHMEEEILKGKDRYRTDASTLGISGLTSNMNMQQLEKFKQSDAYSALDTRKAAAFDKFYADNMNEAKAAYLKHSLYTSQTDSNYIDDAQTRANAAAYNRTVKASQGRYGKKDATGKDKDYKYDFESLLTTDKVTNGGDYKSTKGKAEDDKITFSNSETRGKHFKQEKSNK